MLTFKWWDFRYGQKFVFLQVFFQTLQTILDIENWENYHSTKMFLKFNIQPYCSETVVAEIISA